VASPARGTRSVRRRLAHLHLVSQFCLALEPDRALPVEMLLTPASLLRGEIAHKVVDRAARRQQP
jgi:hypothetical protein